MIEESAEEVLRARHRLEPNGATRGRAIRSSGFPRASGRRVGRSGPLAMPSRLDLLFQLREQVQRLEGFHVVEVGVFDGAHNLGVQGCEDRELHGSSAAIAFAGPEARA